MTWNGIVFKNPRHYIKEPMITPIIKAYMQFIVFKKTIGYISFDYRRGVEEDTGEQIPELCNELETCEVIEETKVDKKDD